eukprot:TRINITY_DN428_c0_g1_i2.p2 TRINITY_DN428_c0_g1~~TRINITY_DN428_c0_g1_i2.p2  ORF type:complete len:129 (-),score=18.60 TRINITY_DN428_c0_g1_i2:311-697(-)
MLRKKRYHNNSSGYQLYSIQISITSNISPIAMVEYEEGTALFFLRQKLGLLICIASVVVLLLMYDKEEQTGYSNNFLVMANFVVIMLGLGVHETRPYKRLEYVRKLVEKEQEEEEAAQEQQQQSKKKK